MVAKSNLLSPVQNDFRRQKKMHSMDDLPRFQRGLRNAFKPPSLMRLLTVTASENHPLKS